uniref:Uncharacterized protein n=1 Tax=Arundo donax TaxID=35708 RepID=A0A0A9SHZ2_ARUDO
MFSSALCL